MFTFTFQTLVQHELKPLDDVTLTFLFCPAVFTHEDHHELLTTGGLELHSGPTDD